MNLSQFLEGKPLYYAEIDYNRMPRVYEKIKEHFNKTKIIHLVGTNGKGTTGRFLAVSLHNMGYTVGHYTSPHIKYFNERIWLNGENVLDTVLESAHQKLQSMLSVSESDSLSFFEYTTFLAMLTFNKCEYIVLEAGLGGQHDATAVFPKTLTLVTPISYDHEAFLGSNISEIATQKLNAIQNYAILAKQNHEEVYTIAQRTEKEINVTIKRLEDILLEEDKALVSEIAHNLDLAEYLSDNLSLSVACLRYLKLKANVGDFKNARLFGRLSKISENVIVDVGHNPLAATSILKALNDGEKYILVYNTYEDKEYKKILEILKPIIKHVEIIQIEDARIESIEILQKVLTDLEIEYDFHETIKKDKKYLVFGSFKVVEEFLKVYNG